AAAVVIPVAAVTITATTKRNASDETDSGGALTAPPLSSESTKISPPNHKPHTSRRFAAATRPYQRPDSTRRNLTRDLLRH
ncbi:MAG TPA: hypothetical protein VIJ65_06460, partial [Acidobacteriaceae bacterium]